jgi:hypothetical protein
MVAHLALTPTARCGRVRGLGTTFAVDVLQGHVSCSTARHVIKFVLTHGHPTQGSPGKSPPGWQCGYGYGFYHGNRRQGGRAGPSCSRGSRIVQGTQAGTRSTRSPAFNDSASTLARSGVERSLGRFELGRLLALGARGPDQRVWPGQRAAGEPAALDASRRHRLRPCATSSRAGSSELGALTAGRGGDPRSDAPASPRSARDHGAPGRDGRRHRPA